MSIPRPAVVLGLLLVSLIAGCANDGESHAKPTVVAGSNAGFEHALAEATAARASEAQLTALREAVDSGEVSIEVAREAARRAVSCMQDAGLDASYTERTRASGLVVPNYAVAGEGGDTQSEACDKKESFWVNQIYQTQPSAVAANQKFIEQKAPVLRACLEKHSYTTDPDASGIDLANQAAQILTDTKGSVDCIGTAGIDGW